MDCYTKGTKLVLWLSNVGLTIWDAITSTKD